MGQYGSLSSSPFVRLSLSLTHHRNFDSKNNKESYIFITACCGSSLISIIITHIYIYTLLSILILYCNFLNVSVGQ